MAYLEAGKDRAYVAELIWCDRTSLHVGSIYFSFH